MKYTQWHDIKTTCPDKPGVYELVRNSPHHHPGRRFSKWSGLRWLAVASSTHDAFNVSSIEWSELVIGGHFTHWRGLATKDGK